MIPVRWLGPFSVQLNLPKLDGFRAWALMHLVEHLLSLTCEEGHPSVAYAYQYCFSLKQTKQHSQ